MSTITRKKMKQKDPQQDPGRKKQASDFLKNADRYLKSGDYGSALLEVERTLEVDPGNFYAIAYKERIVALQAKQPKQPTMQQPPPPAEQSQKPPASAAQPSHSGTTQEDNRKKFLEEKRKQEEETRKQSAEARQRAEEELRRRALELEILRQREEDTRRQAEIERKRLDEQSRRKAREEEQRKHDEEAARQRAADEERKRLELEEQQRKEAERKQREQLALDAAMSKGRQQAKAQYIKQALDRARQLVTQRAFGQASEELMKLVALDHQSSEVRQLDDAILQSQLEAMQPALVEAATIPRAEITKIYLRILTHAWMDGVPDSNQETILNSVRSMLEISIDEHRSVEPHAKTGAYTEVMREGLKSRTSNRTTLEQLPRLKLELSISDAQHAAIEQQVRKEIGL